MAVCGLGGGSVAAGEPADSITISYSTASLAVGQYTGTITITAAGATNSPLNVPVSLTIGAFAPCDLDHDGDVDMDDFGVFQRCLSGDGNIQNDPACAGAKLDADGDVDQLDLNKFRNCLHGAEVMVDAHCAD